MSIIKGKSKCGAFIHSTDHMTAQGWAAKEIIEQISLCLGL